MTPHGRSKRKRSEATEVGASPIQSPSGNTSANQTPTCEEISLRAHEIYLERGLGPGNELDDWLQAERELKRSAPQEGKSTDRNHGRT
jgi:hypothetical protein